MIGGVGRNKKKKASKQLHFRKLDLAVLLDVLCGVAGWGPYAVVLRW